MSNARAPGIATPFGKLNVAPTFFWTGFLTNGAGTVSLPIPTHSSLLKAKVTFQTLVWSLSTAANNFGMSNGTEWILGDY